MNFLTKQEVPYSDFLGIYISECIKIADNLASHKDIQVPEFFAKSFLQHIREIKNTNNSRLLQMKNFHKIILAKTQYNKTMSIYSKDFFHELSILSNISKDEKEIIVLMINDSYKKNITINSAGSQLIALDKDFTSKIDPDFLRKNRKLFEEKNLNTAYINKFSKNFTSRLSHAQHALCNLLTKNESRNDFAAQQCLPFNKNWTIQNLDSVNKLIDMAFIMHQEIEVSKEYAFYTLKYKHLQENILFKEGVYCA